MTSRRRPDRRGSTCEHRVGAHGLLTIQLTTELILIRLPAGQAEPPLGEGMVTVRDTEYVSEDPAGAVT